MSDISETFKALREEGQKKREANKGSSVKILRESGVEFKQLSSDHVRVGSFDFWPSTGLFIHTKTKRRGRGVFNLLKHTKGTA